MSLSCEYCVLSGRSLCDVLIARPEDPIECGREASIMRKPWPNKGCCATGKKDAMKYNEPELQIVCLNKPL